MECTNQRDTITCVAICVVDGLSLSQWTLSFLSTNYCLTRFTCILFLLFEYICFSINPFVFPVSFFGRHHNVYIYIYIYIYIYYGKENKISNNWTGFDIRRNLSITLFINSSVIRCNPTFNSYNKYKPKNCTKVRWI